MQQILQLPPDTWRRDIHHNYEATGWRRVRLALTLTRSSSDGRSRESIKVNEICRVGLLLYPSYSVVKTEAAALLARATCI